MNNHKFNSKDILRKKNIQGREVFFEKDMCYWEEEDGKYGCPFTQEQMKGMSHEERQEKLEVYANKAINVLIKNNEK